MHGKTTIKAKVTGLFPHTNRNKTHKRKSTAKTFWLIKSFFKYDIPIEHITKISVKCGNGLEQWTRRYLKWGVKGLFKSNLTHVTNANHYIHGLLLYLTTSSQTHCNYNPLRKKKLQTRKTYKQILTRGAYILYIPNIIQTSIMHFLYPQSFNTFINLHIFKFTIFFPKAIHILMYIFKYNNMYKVLGLYDSINHGLMPNVNDF